MGSFLILCLVRLVIPTLYAVDVGCENIIVGMASPGKPISIKLPQSGQRSIKNIVSYTPSSSTAGSWSIGSDAELSLTNETRITSNPFSFLDRKPTPFFDEIHPVCVSSIALSLILPNFNPNYDQLVLSVPTSSSPAYRFSLYQSMLLFGAKESQIVDQSTAVATFYGVARLNKTRKGVSTVVFIDIGSSFCEISLWKFGNHKSVMTAKLNDYRISDKVSGDSIDKLLLSYILTNLKRQPKESEVQMIDKKVRKAKEQFSAGINASIDLSDEFNATFLIDSTLLDKLVEPSVSELSKLLSDFSEVPEVELMGGASFFPPFIKAISGSLQGSQVRRSMDSEESIALGSAYYGAIQKKMIAGLKFDIERSSTFSLDLVDGNKSTKIVQVGEKFEPKTVTLSRNSSFFVGLSSSFDRKIDVSYFSQSMNLFINGIEKLMSVWADKLQSPALNVSITFDYEKSLDCFSVASSAASGLVKVGSDINNKLWKLKYELKRMEPEFVPPQNSSSIVREAMKGNWRAKESEEKNSEIQSYIVDLIYKIKNDPCFEAEMTKSEKEKTLKYLENQRTSKTPAKIPEIKAKLYGALFRAEERKERPAALADLQKAIDEAEKALSQKQTNEATFKKITTLIDTTKEWVEKAEDIKPLSPPPILCKDIKRRSEKIKKLTRIVLGLEKEVHKKAKQNRSKEL